MKKVIIFGANSFTGGSITNRLINNNKIEVFATYRKNRESRFFLEKLNKQCKSFQIDLNHFQKLNLLINDVKPDAIIDLTSLVNVRESIRSPKKNFNSSAGSTLNILESLRVNNLSTVYINHSSYAVYGNINTTPFTENMRLFPVEMYGVGKLTQELIANSYNFHYGIPNINIRSSNYYGPYDFDFNRIIPYLMKKFILNEEVKIKSSLNHSRDFLYIEEASSAIELIIKLIFEKEISDFGKSYNFSQEKDYSINDMIKIISNISKKDIEINVENKKEIKESKKLLLDCTKSKSELGWKNKTTFEEGLEKTFKYYLQYLNGENK